MYIIIIYYTPTRYMYSWWYTLYCLYYIISNMFWFVVSYPQGDMWGSICKCTVIIEIVTHVFILEDSSTKYCVHLTLPYLCVCVCVCVCVYIYIQWKLLIMITLGPALFDNNNRLITLSGGYKYLHYLTQFIVTTFYMYKKQYLFKKLM